MENREFGEVIGNSQVPYLNTLAKQYALGTQYYAIMHPSLPNYLALTGGSTFGVSSDCGPEQRGCSITGTSTNIADQLEAGGRSWRAYMESMPSPCALADTKLYAQKHNPFLYFDDIRTNAARCRSHVVPYDQFAADLRSGDVSNYVWITPNLCDDMHDCDLSASDRWLSQNLPPILGSAAFQQGGVLYIVWDEGSSDAGANPTNGAAAGGHVPLLVLSPLAKPGYRSAAPETHYSLLRTIESAWGLAPLGRAAGVAPMDEYFAGG